MTYQSPLVSQLLDQMKERSIPLEIEISDNGAVEAVNYDYGGSYVLSITFIHPEGDIVVGVDYPSRAERYEITAEQLATVPYEKLADLATEYTGDEWRYLDGCAWLTGQEPEAVNCFDAEGKFVKATTELRDRLVQWLGEDDESAFEDAELYPEMSEGLVGFAILASLPPADVKRLGLKVGDLRGGPGGGCERVIFRGDPRLLEATLRRRNMPFIVSIDEQSKQIEHQLFSRLVDRDGAG